MTTTTTIDLRSLELRPGEAVRREQPVVVEPFLLGGERYTVEPRPLLATLELQATADGLYVRLELEAEVRGPCHRCLEPAVLPVSVRAREYAASRPEPGAEEELGSEYLVDERLDVSAWARDAL